jgi:serine-type D-Ala-D-Ala carboxypeptidase/endopeptidase (penicillin-binding protein 4)
VKVAVVLVIVAALSGGSGWAAWQNEHLPGAAAGDEVSMASVTPVLSVRRVPESLMRPRRDAAVAAAVASIPERIPGDSCLVVTEGGRPLFDHGGARPLVPASTQKVLVGAALLDLMSPSDTFDTVVWAETPMVDGIIQGDVWVVGGGDPLLATEAFVERNGEQERPATRFESLADSLVAIGLTRIEGSVIGDGTRYDTVYDVPSWPARYREQVSAGPLAGLTVNDGLTTFTPTRVPTNPGTPAADPPAHAARVLDDLLEERGVTVTRSPGSGSAPDDAVWIAALPSLPVQVIVTQMMQWSDNTTAELLLKEIGVRGGGEGSTLAGGTVMVSTLAGTGVRVDGVAPVDGSGLALDNLVTCQALTDVLDIAGSDSPLADTLAVSGVSGTLRNRLVDTPAVGRLRAKTGSLRHVATLAGFIDSQNGRTYTFAVMANLTDGEFMPGLAFDLQDELALILATLPDLEVTSDLEPLAPVGAPTP